MEARKPPMASRLILFGIGRKPEPEPWGGRHAVSEEPHEREDSLGHTGVKKRIENYGGRRPRCPIPRTTSASPGGQGLTGIEPGHRRAHEGARRSSPERAATRPPRGN